MLTLPVDPTLPSQSFNVVLDGTKYGIDLHWDDRAGMWVLILSDADGNLLLAGRRVGLGSPILRRFRLAGLPPGELVAVDTTGQGIDPGVSDLGARVLLIYYAAADLAALP